MQLRLESRVHPTYASVSVMYQVQHGVTQLWMEEYHRYTQYIHHLGKLPIFRNYLYHLNRTYLLQSYRYVIHTVYGFKILVGFNVTNSTNNKDVSVDILDGPILAKRSFIPQMHEFSYIGGFTVTCNINFINSVLEPQYNFEIVYQKVNQRTTDVKLLNIHDTFNLSLNTMEKDEFLYYKTIRVKSPKSHYVKISLVDIKTFTGASYNCEYGGFVISDFWTNPLAVNGPYCTQHGMEPLVNDVTELHSRNSFIVFIIYAYGNSFQMDIDLSFQSTPCHGLTNICDIICGPFHSVYFRKGKPKHYNLLRRRETKLSCSVSLQLIRGCIKVQGLSNKGLPLCVFNLYVIRNAVMKTVLQMQSNFRYF